jgi:hypothetical protein
MEDVKQASVPDTRKKMLLLLVALVVFVILDGVLTVFLVGGGRAWEANSFLAPLIGGVGFMLLKIVGSLFCAFVLWDIHKRHQKLAVVATWIAVIGYGAIVLWNSSLFFIT